MFKKLFQKSGYEIYNPILGVVVSIEQVPDEVFSKKMVGDGFAIIPHDGNVYSPVKGRIVQIFPTKHAIGIIDENNVEILIHVGIDTVELKGMGFQSFIKKGDLVEVGQLLLKVDLEYISERGKSLITPIVFTNKTQYKTVEVLTGKKAVGELVCTIK